MVKLDERDDEADWPKRTPDTSNDIARGKIIERENRRMAASVNRLEPPSVRRPKR